MSEIKISKEVNEIKEDIKKLNLGQISELIEGLKKDLNIQETVTAQSVSTSTSEKPEEKSNNVSVKWVGKKEGAASLKEILETIRGAVKELKEESINILQAKKLTETGDKIILENISRDKAEEFAKKIGEKGVQVEIK